jgi:hypothetical protein
MIMMLFGPGVTVDTSAKSNTLNTISMFPAELPVTDSLLVNPTKRAASETDSEVWFFDHNS